MMHLISAIRLCVAFLVAHALRFEKRNRSSLNSISESMDENCEFINGGYSVWDVSAEIREHHTLTVKCYYGQLGNNLQQLAHMFFLAETQEATELIVGKPSPWYKKLLNLPERFAIHADPEFRSRVRCSPRHTNYFWVKCDGVQRSDYTRVFRQYLLPHLTEEVQETCKAQKSNTERELVLHLRTGDLLASTHHQSRFAPCAFFTKVARDFQFDHIRIITQTYEHPCIEPLQQRFGTNVTVSSKNILEDICVMLHAKQLALGALSTFSLSLNRFNGQGVQFDAFGACGEEHAVKLTSQHNFVRPFDPTVLAEAKLPCKTLRSVQYCVEGINQIRAHRKSKFEWMLSYEEDDVRRVGDVCNTDLLLDIGPSLQPFEPH
jgi:hypothetical protein